VFGIGFVGDFGFIFVRFRIGRWRGGGCEQVLRIRIVGHGAAVALAGAGFGDGETGG
jgi:hypothetical protein